MRLKNSVRPRCPSFLNHLYANSLSRMEVEDFWKLAEDATLRFSTIAASTAASMPLAIVSKGKGSSFVEISTRLGKLAAMLYIIHNILESPTPDEERIISKRIPKLLALLESLCTVSSFLKRG